ncbi:MAG: hypothetical protein FWE28_08990, partial [Oscillospiraceae bacterium]|nr:hypothetical protein [Oscillospiraceae bacterium]
MLVGLTVPPLGFHVIVIVVPGTGVGVGVGVTAQVTVQEVCPPVAGTVPAGHAGMVGVWFALLRCDAFGQVIVFQAVPTSTFRVSWVLLVLVHPAGGLAVQVAPV